MGRIQTAFVSGTILNNPLAIGDTSLSSAGLSSLAAVAAPDIAALVLDPGGSAGTPEVVWVTAHTAAATTATIARAKESSTARQHAVGIPWVHGATLLDYEGCIPEYIQPVFHYGATFQNGTSVANRSYLIPIQPLTADVTLTTIIGSIGVQSGNIDIAVFDWDGTTMTRLSALGSTACPAANARVVYNIADVALYKGSRYFFGIAVDNNTVSFGVSNPAATYTTPAGGGYLVVAGPPFAATIASGSLTGIGYGPILYGNVTGGTAI